MGGSVFADADTTVAVAYVALFFSFNNDFTVVVKLAG